MLSKEKTKLENLNEEKIICYPPKKIVIRKSVKDTKELNELESFIEFYYSLGYNLDRYHNALENNNLDKLLHQEGYDKSKITIITNYVKEKSSVLTRKSLKKLRTSLKRAKVCAKLAKYMTGIILLLSLGVTIFNPGLAVVISTLGTLIWGTAWITQKFKVKRIEREINSLLLLAKKRVTHTEPVKKSLIIVKQTPRIAQTRILPKNATTYETGNRLVRKLTN